ncbi:MAG: lipoprotein signal peptidase [Bacteroidota bacterium]|nr:lipoprotein signal peptidase [Bacteroidota bacterium]MDP4206548.1 lipoprotein signal peptidase [Bacteroidota bacterium]
MTKLQKASLVVFLVLLIDQAVKIWIKTHMYIGQEYTVFGNWFFIHFIENNGMAFGFEFAGKFGKIFLSLFRIAAVGGIGWFLVKLTKKNYKTGAIIALSLVLAGAIGNIIDCAFYGMMFSESYGQVSQLFPEGGGYSTFLHGRVVDMLYFPLIEGHFPDWFPIMKGEDFLFFRPVFNIADSSISIGIALILLFYRDIFKELEQKETKEETEPEVASDKTEEEA